jgi:hypothetical protein
MTHTGGVGRRTKGRTEVTNALTPFTDNEVLTEDNAFTVLTAHRPCAPEGR